MEATFFTHIENGSKNKTFFVTGHIMDKTKEYNNFSTQEGYYGLHKQCMLVDLDYVTKNLINQYSE